MTTSWNDLLLAFLHDPPDKALDIKGHVERAKRYIGAALGDVAQGKLGGEADQQAARAERLPAPHWKYVKVDPVGSLITFHPLSRQAHTLTVGSCDPAWITGHIRDLVAKAGEETENRFLALWRLLPEQLRVDHSEYARLPADTRIPDHTIWHHLDITAGLQAALEGGHGPAFLSFALGPVQSFISAARTVRDLWSGSMILSYLAFRAILPVLASCGPTALVYPALRGVPLLDLWLGKVKGLRNLIEEPDAKRKLAPCLPNRFLAVVPYGAGGETARKLAEECREAAEKGWQELAQAVHERLKSPQYHLGTGWDGLWEQQISRFFEFRTAVVPWSDFQGSEERVAKLWQLWGAGNKTFKDAFPHPAAVRELHESIPHKEKPGYEGRDGTWHPFARPVVGDWQAKVDHSARLMEAQKSIRQYPSYDPGSGEVPPKCSMLGTCEQMGPANLQESADFWKAASQAVQIDGVRLRDRERLCAVALVKRFSGPCFFRQKLALHRQDLRYDDTATVAAAEWLQRAGIDQDAIREHHGWSGQWLHWPKRDLDEDDDCPSLVWDQIQAAKRAEAPPIYYAVLMMDGDNLGGWLRGDNSPPVKDILHPQLRDYFQKLPNTENGLKAKRPVSPALHAALSSALANFALHVVPEVVEKHRGTLIYAGGDDTLALLPTLQALACVRKLQQAYQSDYYPDDGTGRLMMGNKATLSAGLAVVHYKEDLRAALDAARDAEKQAKKSGRDALVITACRRSGERASALCPWDFADKVSAWVQAFRDNASDRWAYHLRAELTTLQGLPVEAMRAEIRRQISRAEEKTRRAFPPDQLAEDFDCFRQFKKKIGDEEESRFCNDADALTHFLTLVQTASFLARGRDS